MGWGKAELAGSCAEMHSWSATISQRASGGSCLWQFGEPPAAWQDFFRRPGPSRAAHRRRRRPPRRRGGIQSPAAQFTGLQFFANAGDEGHFVVAGAAGQQDGGRRGLCPDLVDELPHQVGLDAGGHLRARYCLVWFEAGVFWGGTGGGGARGLWVAFLFSVVAVWGRGGRWGGAPRGGGGERRGGVFGVFLFCFWVVRLRAVFLRVCLFLFAPPPGQFFFFPWGGVWVR